jgi:hypothetical protein
MSEPDCRWRLLGVYPWMVRLHNIPTSSWGEGGDSILRSGTHARSQTRWVWAGWHVVWFITWLVLFLPIRVYFQLCCHIFLCNLGSNNHKFGLHVGSKIVSVRLHVNQFYNLMNEGEAPRHLVIPPPPTCIIFLTFRCVAWSFNWIL